MSRKIRGRYFGFKAVQDSLLRITNQTLTREVFYGLI